MKIHRGLSYETAIPIDYTFVSDISDKAHKIIEQMLGSVDSDFFIMNENITHDMAKNKYYAVFVEDKDKIRHTIFFKLNLKNVTKLS